MQLDLDEVRVAVVDYLRKRDVIVENSGQVHLEIIDRAGTRLNIVGATPTVVVYNVKLPEGGPYR